MYCYSIIRHYLKIISSVSLVLWLNYAFALNENNLWLPISYQTLYLKLKDAAQAAEDLDRCVDVLDGTIDLEQSTREHPIFRIRCKQESGRTYSEMVDGLTNETLTTPTIVEVMPTEEELELLGLAEEKRKLEEKEARIQNLWSKCDLGFRDKTRLMINVQAPSIEIAPVPEVYEEERTIFIFDFDAEDISGARLKYRAKCEVNEEQVLELQIGKRPEALN